MVTTFFQNYPRQFLSAGRRSMRANRSAYIFLSYALSLLLALAFASAWLGKVAAVPIGNPGTADFFVSPRGKDTWSGKQADPAGNDGPFATVARARDAVRKLLKTQKEPRPVRVMLRGATYFLDS